MQNKPKLFCFTYAGGTKEFFNVIENDLPDIELIKIEYAGHGERHKEAFYKDFDELADDIFQKVKDQLFGNYALFGYSMGSITLMELLKRIIKSGLPQPGYIFLAAHEPYTKTELQDFTPDELDEWVKDRTIKFGAVPQKLIKNKVFWRTYLPLYRADYTIIYKYEFERLNLKTDIPATVFYSETDTPLSEMEGWKKYFIGSCKFCQCSGTHFFIQDHHKEMAVIIRQNLEKNYDI